MNFFSCWPWVLVIGRDADNYFSWYFEGKLSFIIYIFWTKIHPMFPTTIDKQKIEEIASRLSQLVCHWDIDLIAFFLFARWKKEEINPIVEKKRPIEEKIIISTMLIWFKNCSSPTIEVSPKPKPERTVKRIIDGAGCIITY